MEQTTTLVLAGGRGERLFPLTKTRAKPAVPFGGMYRIIDFTLSNCLNSKLRRVHLLTQYSSLTLDRYIRDAWSNHERSRGLYVELVPPQARIADKWYAGTADSIFQNIFLLEEEKPERVLILSGDHIYKMDYRRFLDAHEQHGADLTIAVLPVPVEQAHLFGVLTVDASNRILNFEEKPQDPKTIPNDPTKALVSMGVYCFRTKELLRALIEDSKKANSNHDFGKDVVPAMLQAGYRVFAYPFHDENRKEVLYWRDIGSIDHYYTANLDLVNVDPLFNLYDETWQIRGGPTRQLPPAKTVFDNDDRRGLAVDSLLAPGVIVSGSTVRRSILSYSCFIHSWAEVEECILLPRVDIGRNVRIRRAIVEEGVHIAEGDVIGYDLEVDRRRFTITDNGIVIVTANAPERRID